MKKTLIVIWAILCPYKILLAQENYAICTDKISLHVNEHGKGKVVVLLAGGPGFNAAYLEPIWKSLPNYRFVVPDQRGTGLSSMTKIDTAAMRVDAYVEDLELLRKHLALPKLVIAGHSWGGMLALAYAAKYPKNVDRLILLGSGGVTKNFFQYFGSNIRMRLNPEDLAEAKAAHTMAGNLKAIWPGYFFNRESALATKALVDTNLANHDASRINKLTLNDYKDGGTLRAIALHKLKSPVYIIQGRQDPVGESTIFETQHMLPQSRVFFIEQCGHLPWLENEVTAKRFYELVRNALE